MKAIRKRGGESNKSVSLIKLKFKSRPTHMPPDKRYELLKTTYTISKFNEIQGNCENEERNLNMKMEIRINGMEVGYEIDVPESGYDRELRKKEGK